MGALALGGGGEGGGVVFAGANDILLMLRGEGPSGLRIEKGVGVCRHTVNGEGGRGGGEFGGR